MVKKLLASGADKEARDEFDETAFHEAAGMGHVKVILALLEAGADKEARDR